ncbi:Na+ dependent nucleoside transporter N-terminal domain-containing protein [Psychromonas hadalis]|uniref:Na+ dependent nucleoside transporter N-terminal domain-containing protein n=1 Tax=Psychromonas hadalis TaxID=211669 RepID=UPI001FE23A24|nr:Na+ dependent nucleoside transporter N-terminal domain-containing protein [Psychromonas hadalis]
MKLRTVGTAFLLQFIIGAMVLCLPWGMKVLEVMSHGVHAVLDSGKAGINFLFGNLVNFSVDGIGFVFTLNVVPLVVFFSALISVLYYLGKRSGTSTSFKTPSIIFNSSLNTSDTTKPRYLFYKRSRLHHLFATTGRT